MTVTRISVSRVFAALVALTLGILVLLPSSAWAKSETYAVTADPHVRFQGDDSLITNNADTKRAFRWVATLPNLKAVIVAGDVADRGFRGDFTAYDLLWRGAKIDAKRIQCIGNHDTNNGGRLSKLKVSECAEYFRQINGGKTTSFDEFEYANIMTIGGPYYSDSKSVYSQAMLKQLNDRLRKTVRQGKMAIVVSHYPYTSGIKGTSAMLGILKSYPNVIYVSGHRHYYSSSDWFKKASPSAKTTPYTRTGIKASKASYPFRSLGVDSITRNHQVHRVWKSKGQSIANSLRITDKGAIVYKRFNLMTGELTNAWTMKQLKGSVTVKTKATNKGALPAAAKKGAISYKVVFSDGKSYGGVNSGDVIKLKVGKSKTFKGIPAGVLVTVKCVAAPKGWTKSKNANVEVGSSQKVVTVKHRYKAAKSTADNTANKEQQPAFTTQSIA